METERNGPGAEPPDAAPRRLARPSTLPLVQLRWPWVSACVLAAFHVATCATLWATAFPRGRVAAVAACWAVQAATTLRFTIRGTAPMNPGAYPQGAVRLGIVHLVTSAIVVAVTGALHSPLFVILLMPSITSLALFGAARESRLLGAVTAACIVLLGVLPGASAGPALPRAAADVLALASVFTSIAVVGTNVLRLRGALRECGRELSRVREELASQALARARELEEVASQVAHELKNPLAAVKALAQLGSGGDAGHTPAGFAAVDAEVARMQETLARYLSFARPLDELKPARVEPRRETTVALRLPWTTFAVAVAFNVVATGAPYLDGLSRARVAGVAAISLVKVVVTLWYAVRPSPHELGTYPSSALVLSLVHVVGGAGWMALTGGLQSPFLVTQFPPPIVSFALFDAVWQSRVVLAVTAASIVLLAALPGDLTGPALVGPGAGVVAAAGALSAMVIVGANLVRARDLLGANARELARTRDALAAHAAERARTLGEMGAKVASELERPLAEVGRLAGEGAGAADDARAREWFEVIDREVARMQGILADYVAFSRPLQSFRPQRVDLGPLVADVLAVLSGRAASAGVREDCRGDASVTGDPRRLKEALLNLVANAIDATPPGGRVDVQIGGADGDAQIVIRDTGRGMPPDVLERLGTPFFTTREAGTGLGVVLARSVFHRHGGAVRYESAPGVGTTVIATLPFHSAGRRTHGERTLG